MPPRTGTDRIATMVQRELAKNPAVGNDVLRQKAHALDPQVRRLSARQFHATYRLPALRRVQAHGPAAPAPATSASAPTSGESRKSTVASPPAPSIIVPSPSAAAAPAGPPAQETEPTETHIASAPAPGSQRPSTSTALTRPYAAEREAVRQILQVVAREALVTEDRASFVRLLDSLDERAAVILGLFRRG